MTLQELFNLNWDWFIVKKNPPGFDIDMDQCVYRGEDGCRCAIGVAMPDDLALSLRQNLPINTHINENPAVEQLFAGIPGEALYVLQSSHDGALRASLTGFGFHNYFENKLRRVAHKCSLAIPETA